ncbi:hypothetical protein HPB49_025462 [Dermacentor silvarum]|uniref:Uncharacterized protein n=1 Tax=Dermacentor silvarum TaxID=543639 RepID=A0ACB8CNJ0_DERSI|nr:hypothetical protein HPB49_025462 [Dermacentor silvarum]
MIGSKRTPDKLAAYTQSLLAAAITAFLTRGKDTLAVYRSVDAVIIEAVDAASPEWTEHPLATSEIAGMPVTARLPGDRSQSSGVVKGVYGNNADEDLLAVVSSKVRVVAAKRQGITLVLRFAVPPPPPPARINLFSMPFEDGSPGLALCSVLRCGCYGHATATCRRPVWCLRCDGPHQTESFCSSRVRCLHCGGPHPADSPDCQLWQREAAPGHHKGVSSHTPVASRGPGGPAGCPHQLSSSCFRSASRYTGRRQNLRCSTRRS